MVLRLLKFPTLFILLLFVQLSLVAQQSPQKDLIDSGILKAKMGDLREALKDLNRAVSLDTNEAEPYYNRGIVRSELKDYQGAISDFTKVIGSSPPMPNLTLTAGWQKITSVITLGPSGIIMQH